MKTAADLLPARASSLRGHHLPTLPAWYPLDRRPTEDDPHPAPYTDAERAELRHRKTLEEASAGPFDGQRMAVRYPDRGTPPEVFIPAGHPGIVYRLDHEGSTLHKLRYRYDPDSPIHPDLMRAVTTAYAEAGPAYTLTARQESSDDRTPPIL